MDILRVVGKVGGLAHTPWKGEIANDERVNVVDSILIGQHVSAHLCNTIFFMVQFRLMLLPHLV
jgi:hypothetical protein